VEVAGLGVEEGEVRLHRLHLQPQSRGAKHQTVAAAETENPEAGEKEVGVGTS
jgi:hypothetical protein